MSYFTTIEEFTNEPIVHDSIEIMKSGFHAGTISSAVCIGLNLVGVPVPPVPTSLLVGSIFAIKKKYDIDQLSDEFKDFMNEYC